MTPEEKSRRLAIVLWIAGALVTVFIFFLGKLWSSEQLVKIDPNDLKRLKEGSLANASSGAPSITNNPKIVKSLTKPTKRRQPSSSAPSDTQTAGDDQSQTEQPRPEPTSQSLTHNNPPAEAKPEYVTVDICTDTGMRAAIYCPQIIQKTFVKGTEPQVKCNQHTDWPDAPKASIGKVSPTSLAPGDVPINTNDELRVLENEIRVFSRTNQLGKRMFDQLSSGQAQDRVRSLGEMQQAGFFQGLNLTLDDQSSWNDMAHKINEFYDAHKGSSGQLSSDLRNNRWRP